MKLKNWSKLRIFVRFYFILILLTHMSLETAAQQNLDYQLPDQAIVDLIEAPSTPAASLSPDGNTMLLLSRPSLPSIGELAEEELRLAGIRINPRTNGSSRAAHYNGIKLLGVYSGEEIKIEGLPGELEIENVSWAPNGSKIAFTLTVEEGMELWVLDAADGRATKLTLATVNDAMPGVPYRWFSDSQNLIFKQVLKDRGAVPRGNSLPSGPVIQENLGKSAPVRTYQDLLKNPHDEALFEYYTTSQLHVVNLPNLEYMQFGEPGIISEFTTSPDGQYILVGRCKKPYSYIVQYNRFPKEMNIHDRLGRIVKKVADIPIAENIPKGFGAVRTGPRSFSWRNDVPATLIWVEAQDGGDPKKESAIRDRLFFLEAPFETTKPVLDFKLRYAGVTWGNDDMAISYEWWWANRKLLTSRWSPGAEEVDKTTLFDRSFEDRYNDPGDFKTHRNEYGRNILLTADGDNTLFLSGQGASPEGNRPFLDEFDLSTKKTKRLWRSEAPYYEQLIRILDVEKREVLTRKESQDIPANYYIKNLSTKATKQLTFFTNPYTALEGVKKELIKYKRADGVELTGTLYLPENYDPKRDGRLPVLMWAYPREFKSADAAGQVTDSPYEFIRIGWWSPLFWVTQGYAVFDDFGMPIIGEGEEEPNETFIEQLSSGAEAAAKKLYDMGVADTSRLAVGGHSYGAFMTANLLAHTDLFAAGIARSGAYNRTLTPFGFQSEERTFWEAPETYFKMSPFMSADKIKAPLLMIHGEADNNSGTFPMQSERMYGALKGHGATVRLVMLPHESHGYRARESVMHMLWEMSVWLDKYVKNKS